MKKYIFHLAIATGLLAAPLYLTLLIVLGALEPGFSHLTMPMSILGGVSGERGLVFNIGVAITGIFIIVFAFGFYQLLPSKLSAKFAFGFLVAGGMGLIGAGYFHCNDGCKNILIDPDIVGRLHIAASLLAGMASGIAPFFAWAAMRSSQKWKSLATPTLLAGVLANLPGVTFWVTFSTGYRLQSVEGLIQRLGFVFLLIWIFYITLRLLMKASREE
ncbi:DUF998 domain-containing protein [Kaarinaea lacus]